MKFIFTSNRFLDELSEEELFFTFDSSICVAKSSSLDVDLTLLLFVESCLVVLFCSFFNKVSFIFVVALVL
jgi:hypothetical protein